MQEIFLQIKSKPNQELIKNNPNYIYFFGVLRNEGAIELLKLLNFTIIRIINKHNNARFMAINEYNSQQLSDLKNDLSLLKKSKYVSYNPSFEGQIEWATLTCEPTELRWNSFDLISFKEQWGNRDIDQAKNSRQEIVKIILETKKISPHLLDILKSQGIYNLKYNLVSKPSSNTKDLYILKISSHNALRGVNFVQSLLLECGGFEGSIYIYYLNQVFSSKGFES
jgi:hypothetical protein